MLSILCLKGCVLDSFVPYKVHIYYTGIPQSIRCSLNSSTHFKPLKVIGPDKQDVCCLGGWLCLHFISIKRTHTMCPIRVSPHHPKHHVFLIWMVVNHQNNTFFMILLNHTRQIFCIYSRDFYICQQEVKFITFGIGGFTHWPPGKEGGMATEFLQPWEWGK